MSRLTQRLTETSQAKGNQINWGTTVEIKTLQGNLFLEDLAFKCGGLNQDGHPLHKPQLEELKKEIKHYRLDSRNYMDLLLAKSLVIGKLLRHLLESLCKVIGSVRTNQPDLIYQKSLQDWGWDTIKILEEQLKSKTKTAEEKEALRKCKEAVLEHFKQLDESHRQAKSYLNMFVDTSSQKNPLFVVHSNEEAYENYVATFARFMRSFLRSADDFRGYATVDTNVFLAEYNTLLNLQAQSAQYSLILGKLFEIHHELQQELEALGQLELPKSIERPNQFSLSSLLDTKKHQGHCRELNRLVKKKLEIPFKYKLDEADEDLKNFFNGIYSLNYNGSGFLARRWIKVVATELKAYQNDDKYLYNPPNKKFVMVIDVVGQLNIVARDRDLTESMRGLAFKTWVASKDNVLLAGIHCSLVQLAADPHNKSLGIEITGDEPDTERHFRYRFQVEQADSNKIGAFQKVFEQAAKSQLWARS